MRSDLFSSLTSPRPPPLPHPSAPVSITQRHPVPTPATISRRRASRFHICASGDRNPPAARGDIGNPKPPWLICPPVAPEHPDSDDLPPSLDVRAIRSDVGVPFSIRLLQLRKKRRLISSRTPPSADVGCVGNAIRSLASVMEDLQRPYVAVDVGSRTEEPGLDALSETSQSVFWLFHKVFFASPNLVVGVLVLVAKFLATSTKREIPNLIVSVLESRTECSTYASPRSWFDIGVLDGTERSMASVDVDGGRSDYMRRRTAYEKMIISGNMSSLILSNYAQLLYQYGEDLDRAHDIFRWAVMAKPVDAEAMSRYALFLWHARGDIEGAEEMFLEAIEAGSDNTYYRSSYSYFLWKSGALETCFPLEEGGGGGGEQDLILKERCVEWRDFIADVLEGLPGKLDP